MKKLCMDMTVITQLYITQLYCHAVDILCTGWGIKISTFRKGTVRAVVVVERWGVVSCGWLASTVVSTHNGLDR